MYIFIIHFKNKLMEIKKRKLIKDVSKPKVLVTIILIR